MSCLKCNKCHQMLPVERFSRDPSRTRGYRFACKDCRKKQRAETEGLPREIEAAVVVAWSAHQAQLPVTHGALVPNLGRMEPNMGMAA